MTDDLFYSPNRKPSPPRQAVPGEHVWTLRKSYQTVSCELRTHGPQLFEAQLLRDGSFYAGRRFVLRADAVAHAAHCRQDLQADGWVVQQAPKNGREV